MAESQENFEDRVNEFWDLYESMKEDYTRLVDDTMEEYLGRITNLGNEEINALIDTPRGRIEKDKFEGRTYNVNSIQPWYRREMDSPAGKSLIRKLIDMDALFPEDSDQKHEERSEFPLLVGIPRPPGLTEAQWTIIQAEQALLDSDRRYGRDNQVFYANHDRRQVSASP